MIKSDIKFPDYETIKALPKNQTHRFKVFTVMPSIYFRFTYNEEDNNQISLDFLKDGYLDEYYMPGSYKLNEFYKFNKKNYLALEKLAQKIQNKIINDINKKQNFCIESY